MINFIYLIAHGRYSEQLFSLCILHFKHKVNWLATIFYYFWSTFSYQTSLNYFIIVFFLILKKFFHFSFLPPFLPFQVLRNAVSKTYNRISDLRKEILSLKKNVVSAEEAAAKAKAELDAAESKLTLVDGEPVLGENPARMKPLKSNAEKTKEEEISLRDSLEAKEALLARALDENEVIGIKISCAILFSSSASIVNGVLYCHTILYHILLGCYEDNEACGVGL